MQTISKKETPINNIIQMRSHTHKAVQTYALFVGDKRDIRSIHSTNEDQRERTIIVIAVYLDSKMAHA